MDRPDPANWNRLVFIVVHLDDAGDYADTLLEGGFSHTRVSGSGGFLRNENVVFMVAVDSARLGDLERLTERTCRTRNEFVTLPWTGEIDVASPIEVTVGGATMLVLEMEKAIRI